MICRPIRVLTTSGQISNEIGKVSRQGADQFLSEPQTSSRQAKVASVRACRVEVEGTR